MMIDASLGRGSCCGYPPCGTQPERPRPPMPPMPPQPPREPDVLSVRMSTAVMGVAAGAVIPLNGAVRSFGDGLSYDAANHTVNVCEGGVYAVSWQLLMQSADAPADAVIALQSLDGQTVLGSSGALDVPADGAVLVSGSAVGYLPAGSTWALVNQSGTAMNIPAAGTAPVSFAAALTVAEIGGRAGRQGRRQPCGCGQSPFPPQQNPFPPVNPFPPQNDFPAERGGYPFSGGQ